MRPQRQRRTTAQNGPVAARFGLADWLALVWARTVAVNRGRAVLAVPVLFAAGTAGYFAWPVEPPLGFALMGLLGCGALYLWFARVDPQPGTAGWMRLALCLSAVMAGHVSAQIGTLARDHTILERETRPFRAAAWVEAVERREDGARRPRRLSQPPLIMPASFISNRSARWASRWARPSL